MKVKCERCHTPWPAERMTSVYGLGMCEICVRVIVFPFRTIRQAQRYALRQMRKPVRVKKPRVQPSGLEHELKTVERHPFRYANLKNPDGGEAVRRALEEQA